jgi:hypothetical protein
MKLSTAIAGALLVTLFSAAGAKAESGRAPQAGNLNLPCCIGFCGKLYNQRHKRGMKSCIDNNLAAGRCRLCGPRPARWQ